MNNSQYQPPGTTGIFHSVQPLRDLESNWAVDLAKNLSEYLLKICSGEITSADQDVPQLSVNFAEAALLLQGSVQVYSRKVEYLYSLVLHALDFISRKSAQEQGTNAAAQSEESGSEAPREEEDDAYWGEDDIPVEAKNSLDGASSKDVLANHFVRPPANLVVLEGDCLDAIGDAGELESYLLATTDLFQDFVLLDSCDAIAVIDFLNSQSKAGKLHNDVCRGSSLNGKSRKSFQSPIRRSGGTGHKTAQKYQDANQSPLVNHGTELNDHGVGPSPPANDFPGDEGDFFDMENQDAESDDSDSDDPWKPLNPHEPGNLKVKPYKRVKVKRRLGVNLRKSDPLMADFPLARLDGPSPEFSEIWAARRSTLHRPAEPHSPPPFEKLRQSFFAEGRNTEYNAIPIPEENNTDYGYDSEDPGNEQPDLDIPENTYIYEDAPQQDKHDGDVHLDPDEGYGNPTSHASLEDLCRSHLDSLLASLAETEKQTELAARVSTWKQRIDHSLEEQDARPPFDIHEYGGRVIDKLHMAGDTGSSMSFANVVNGQEKHDVARTFSALLQLVNNGDVDLEKSGGGGESVCFTVDNPFFVHLLQNEKRRDVAPPQSSKKRAKSPKRYTKGERHKPAKENRSPTDITSSVSTSNCRFSVKLRKPAVTKCTPEGKKR